MLNRHLSEVGMLAQAKAMAVLAACLREHPDFPQNSLRARQQWFTPITDEDEGKECLLVGIVDFGENIVMVVFCKLFDGWQNGTLTLMYSGIRGFNALECQFGFRGNNVVVVPVDRR